MGMGSRAGFGKLCKQEEVEAMMHEQVDLKQVV